MKKIAIIALILCAKLGFGQIPTPQAMLEAIKNNSVITSSLSATDRAIADSTKSNTGSSEAYLKAVNESTLTGLGVSSQITYTTAFVTKASAGVLYGCFGYNSKVTGQFILFFNNTSIPADATAPFIAAIYVPALSPFSFDTGKYGIPFSTGIVWSNSSTPQTKTIGSSDVQITVIYK